MQSIQHRESTWSGYCLTASSGGSRQNGHANLRAKTSEESGQFGLAAGVRFGKHRFNWVRAVSRLTPSEAAAPSIPEPEASFAANFASAAVRPNAAQNCVASGRSGDLRSVNRRIRRPALNKSLPNAVTGIASTRSQGASSRSTTIGAIGLSAAAFRVQSEGNQLLQLAIAGGIAGRRATPYEVEVVAKQILRRQNSFALRGRSRR